ncbi:MAG TPA: hypothetical protein VGN37_23815 [Actinocatenispora sp.]
MSNEPGWPDEASPFPSFDQTTGPTPGPPQYPAGPPTPGGPPGPAYGPPAPGGPPGPAGPPPGYGPPQAFGAPGMPPPGYPPKRRGWVVPVVVIVVVVLVGGLVTGGLVLVATLSRGTPAHHSATSATPSTSPSGSPSPTGKPVYAKLPDACQIGGALPKRAKGVKPDGSNSSTQQQLCQWQSLTTAKGVSLDVTLTLADSADTAHRGYQEDLDYAGDESENGGDEGNVQKLPKLGDEAFAAAVAGPIISGKTEADALTYPLTGGKVVARARNVVVEVEYRAAVYDKPRTGRTLHGHGMSYDEARKAATTAAQHYLTLLK